MSEVNGECSAFGGYRTLLAICGDRIRFTLGIIRLWISVRGAVAGPDDVVPGGAVLPAGGSIRGAEPWVSAAFEGSLEEAFEVVLDEMLDEMLGGVLDEVLDGVPAVVSVRGRFEQELIPSTTMAIRDARLQNGPRLEMVEINESDRMAQF
jgi:hypothetical protein